MFKGISRTIAGKEAVKFKFDVQIVQLEHLPAPVKSCRVVWSRQAKVQVTPQVPVNSGTAKFNETLSQVATLYKDNKGNYEPKEYSFKVEVPGKAEQWLTLGRTPIDMVRYVALENSPQNAMIPVQFKVGSGSTGYLKVVITATLLKALTNEDAMTDVSGMTGMTARFGHTEQDLTGFDDNLSRSSAGSDKGPRKLYGATTKAVDVPQAKPMPAPLNVQALGMKPGKQEVRGKVEDDDDVSPLSESPEDSPRVPEPRPSSKTAAAAPPAKVEKSPEPAPRRDPARALEEDRRALLGSDKPSRGKTPDVAVAEAPKARSVSRPREASGSAAIGVTADSTGDSQQLRVLQAENEKLRAQIEALREANLQFDEANREFVKREERLKQQREDYKAKVVQLEEALREAVATVQRSAPQQADPGEIERLQQQLAEAEERQAKAKAEMDKRVADAYKMVDESIIVAARSEQDKNSLKDEVARLQALLGETRAEVVQLETAKAAIEAERDAARDEAAKAKEAPAARSRAAEAGLAAASGWVPAAAAAAKDEEIESLRAQLANLQSRLGDMQALSDETDQSDRIAQLEAELAAAQGVAKDAEFKVFKERTDLQRQLADAEARAHELEAAAQKLEAANQKLESLLDDANGRLRSGGGAEEKLVVTQQKLMEAEHRLAEVEEALAALEPRYALLQQQHAVVQHRCEELELQVSSQNATIDDLRERGGKRGFDESEEDEEDQQQGLRDTVAQLQKQVAELQAHVASLEDENETLERRLGEEEEERGALEERLRAHLEEDGDDAANETVAAYEDKYNKLKAKYRELEEKAKATDAELAEAHDRIERLEKQLRSLGSARDAAEKQTEALESSVKAGRSAAAEVESMRKENESLMLELVACKLELAQVSEREIIARRELYKAKETHMKLAAKMTKLETMLWSKDAKKK